MYFGSNDIIDNYYRIDIEEGDTGSIVKLNKKEMDNKSVKNIADYLRSIIPVPTYRFERGILISGEEKLELSIIDDIFKDSYENVHLIYWKYPYEDIEYRLREGCRYLSLEECHHVINLISPPPSHGCTTVTLLVDLCDEREIYIKIPEECRKDDTDRRCSCGGVYIPYMAVDVPNQKGTTMVYSCNKCGQAFEA